MAKTRSIDGIARLVLAGASRQAIEMHGERILGDKKCEPKQGKRRGFAPVGSLQRLSRTGHDQEQYV